VQTWLEELRKTAVKLGASHVVLRINVGKRGVKRTAPQRGKKKVPGKIGNKLQQQPKGRVECHAKVPPPEVDTGQQGDAVRGRDRGTI